MPDFEFATIRVVPYAPARPDPLNIGVILHDPDKGVAFRKITDNWPEVRRRTGFGTTRARTMKANRAHSRLNATT